MDHHRAEARRRSLPWEAGRWEPGQRLEEGGNAPSETIESRIDGPFSGWMGGTIYQLRNGQRWQQASYSCLASYSYAPRVLVYRSGEGYWMQVEGVDEEVPVRRVY